MMKLNVSVDNATGAMVSMENLSFSNVPIYVNKVFGISQDLYHITQDI